MSPDDFLDVSAAIVKATHRANIKNIFSQVTSRIEIFQGFFSFLSHFIFLSGSLKRQGGGRVSAAPLVPKESGVSLRITKGELSSKKETCNFTGNWPRFDNFKKNYIFIFPRPDIFFLCKYVYWTPHVHGPFSVITCENSKRTGAILIKLDVLESQDQENVLRLNLFVNPYIVVHSRSSRFLYQRIYFTPCICTSLF